MLPPAVPPPCPPPVVRVEPTPKTIAAVERKLSIISEAAIRLGEHGPDADFGQRECVHDLAAEFDLTLSQLHALKHLEVPYSQRELAQQLNYDASNVTDIVDRLEERGLVTRTIDPSDSRVRRLVLTPEGEAVRRKLFERVLFSA